MAAADGKPGQWSLYHGDGKLIARGPDRLGNETPAVALTFPLWTAKGELTADARCPKANSPDPSDWKHLTEVKLSDPAAGKWTWLPAVRCN
jgi:hypothetical protein